MKYQVLARRVIFTDYKLARIQPSLCEPTDDKLPRKRPILLDRLKSEHTGLTHYHLHAKRALTFWLILQMLLNSLACRTGL